MPTGSTRPTCRRRSMARRSRPSRERRALRCGRNGRGGALVPLAEGDRCEVPEVPLPQRQQDLQLHPAARDHHGLRRDRERYGRGAAGWSDGGRGNGEGKRAGAAISRSWRSGTKRSSAPALTCWGSNRTSRGKKETRWSNLFVMPADTVPADRARAVRHQWGGYQRVDGRQYAALRVRVSCDMRTRSG